MFPKPKQLTTVGIVQLFLASSFVIWFWIFPNTAIKFAWPVVPFETALFFGAGFVVRAYIGYFLWREKTWTGLRWQAAANIAFLVVIFLATYWHIDEMNWRASILVAHIWVLAYTIEPVILYLIEPRSAEARAPLPAGLRQGAVLTGLQRVSVVGLVVCVVLAGTAFLNPQFLNTRWPWELDPFNARIMAAFFTLIGMWCLEVYQAEWWGEVRMAVFGLLLFTASNFGAWLVMLPGLDPARKNIYIYGIATAVFSILLAYYIYRQEQAARKAG